MPTPRSFNPTYRFRHRKPIPIAAQTVALPSDLEAQSRTRQERMLLVAEAGHEEAVRWLQRRGLKRWVKGGREII
jgi:hypothetical protein